MGALNIFVDTSAVRRLWHVKRVYPFERNSRLIRIHTKGSE